MVDVAHLQWLASEPGGDRWLRALPTLVAECTARWSLRLGPAYPDAHVSYTAPVVTADGTDAVLKVQFPHPECRDEAEALRRWRGDGAVELLDEAPDQHALLLERCVPGEHLGRWSDRTGAATLGVMVDLLRRLSVPAAEPFRTLRDEAAMWVEHLGAGGRARAREPELVAAAVAELRELGGTSEASVLLHQDLHGANVLSATRSSWLAIDPKPLVGDPAFAVAPVVRSAELGTDRREVLERLDRLCAELDLDRDRARGWTVGQSIAWADDGEHGDWCRQVARWVLEA